MLVNIQVLWDKIMPPGKKNTDDLEVFVASIFKMWVVKDGRLICNPKIEAARSSETS
jgi:hypothetical protein